MRVAESENGSVLMEYVIVNLAITVPIFLLWHWGIYDSSTGTWKGEFGFGIQAMFQRVLSGIALPIP